MYMRIKDIPILKLINLAAIFIYANWAFCQNNSVYYANESQHGYFEASNSAEQPCITQQQYIALEQEVQTNCRLLHLNQPVQNRILSTAFSWPLRAAAGFTDCGFYGISAHVDHDNAATTYKDYNCGTIAYDGHKGTDIATYPFGFYKMDNNQVEVIAAAPGTIVGRSDGNFDRNCAMNNSTANYIIIRHSDGSTALYWHMKKNSVTTKTVGQTVVAGEYLGVVGSSGSSTGPHLHFEVWSGSTNATVVDPYTGTCNILNASSWWAVQKPYTEPSILKASVHTTDVVTPGCPTTEIPNESTIYTIPFQGAGLSAGYAKFYVFFRNETTGMNVSGSILNPDGSIFNSWNFTSTTTYNFSWRSWSKLLPTNPGVYTFKATYNGTSCSQTFTIVNPALTATITTNKSTNICQGDSIILTASTGNSYLWSNGLTSKSITVKTGGSYNVTVYYGGGSSSTSAATIVTVNSLPTATITASSPTAFCLGDSVVLTSSVGNSYVWNNGLTSRSITVKTNGNYNVKVTDVNGCSKTSSNTNVTVITPQNNLTIVARNDTLFSPYNAKNYWYKTGTATPIDSGLFYKCTQSGSYYAIGKDVNGCNAKSNTTNTNCTVTAVSQIKNDAKISVFPNPTDNLINIEITGNKNNHYTFRLVNTLGQIMITEQEKIVDNSVYKVLSLSTFPSGLYLLYIESENERTVVKINKSR